MRRPASWLIDGPSGNCSLCSARRRRVRPLICFSPVMPGGLLRNYGYFEVRLPPGDAIGEGIEDMSYQTAQKREPADKGRAYRGWTSSRGRPPIAAITMLEIQTIQP